MPPNHGLSRGQIARLIAEERTRRVAQLGNEALRWGHQPQTFSFLVASCMFFLQTRDAPLQFMGIGFALLHEEP